MVVECLIPDTEEIVAVKMLKDPAAIREAEDEVCFCYCAHITQRKMEHSSESVLWLQVQMLEVVSQLDCDNFNIVRFRERFDYLGLTCLVFERLDISLFHLIRNRPRVTAQKIRPIAQQVCICSRFS